MKAPCSLCRKPTRLDLSRVPAGCECSRSCFPNCWRTVPMPVRHPECHEAFMAPIEEPKHGAKLPGD